MGAVEASLLRGFDNDTDISDEIGFSVDLGFMSEIGEEGVIDFSEEILESEEEEATPQSYRVGDTVFHTDFGKGTIVSSKVTGDKIILTIAFVDKGIKKIDPSIASLLKP